MTIGRPTLIDKAMSDELHLILERGETASVEFKRDIPSHVGGLAKVIAGFATSGAGRIFIGVDDDGTPLGLPDCGEHDGQNRFRSRIEGILTTVKPVVHVAIRFASAPGTGAIVAVIEVSKGSQPVYYASHIPYHRQLTATHPMTPDDVIAHIRAWERDSKPSAEDRYLNDLAQFLLDADVMVRERRDRSRPPLVDALRSDAGRLAERARAVAATAPASLADTAAPLEEMADHLVTLERERPAINSSRTEIFGALQTLDESIRLLRARWLPPEYYGEAVLRQVRDTLLATARQLTGLARRAESPAAGMRFAEGQHEAAKRGAELLRCVSLGVGLGGPERADALGEIASRLRDMATRRNYDDGGLSWQQLVRDIAEADRELTSWLAGLAASGESSAG